MGGIHRKGCEGVGSSDGGNFVHGDEGRRRKARPRTIPEDGHEPRSRVGPCAGVAAKGEQVDLVAGGARIVACDGEETVGTGKDVGAYGVRAVAGSEQRLGGVAVAGGVGSKKIDASSANRLTTSVDLALECASYLGQRRGGWAERATRDKQV